MNYRLNRLKLSIFWIGLVNVFSTPAITENVVNTIFTGAAVVGAIVTGGTSWVVSKELQEARPVVTAVAALTAYSVTRGLQNMRRDQQMLLNIEKTYGLTQQYGFLEMPGVAFRDALSMPVEDTMITKVDPFMIAVKDKVRSLKELHPLALWDFGMFTHFLPHTDMGGVYGVSVNYFQPFHAPYMKKLKESVNFHIQMIESDFNTLKQMSSLWSFGGSFAEYGVKIPKTQTAFIELLDALNQNSQHTIITTFGGIFGYSPLHNSDRVKTAMTVLSEYHIYLLQLREFLSTCAQDDFVDLQDTSGYLSFLVQHTHFVRENK
jgi:hypothetical protein